MALAIGAISTAGRSVRPMSGATELNERLRELIEVVRTSEISDDVAPAWIERVEGRKTFASGELRAGDQLCAEVEGIFIQTDLSSFMMR